MHKLESVQEYETHKILGNFEVEIRRPGLILINIKKVVIKWILLFLRTIEWR